MKVISEVSRNPRKVYKIKRYRCGHYYLNQTIDGKLFYKAWHRSTSKYVKDIFGLSFKDFYCED